MTVCGSTYHLEIEGNTCLRVFCNKPAKWQLLSIERNGEVRDREARGVYECDEHKEDIEKSGRAVKGMNLVWRQL